MPSASRRCLHALAATALALAMLASLAACSDSSGSDAQAVAAKPANVTLTKDQRQHIRLYTVTPSSFHAAVETTGVVDFDNDQATSVLAPFSGPVTRLLVSPGQHVRKGEPLALVDSPDFAAAIGAYRKALVAASNARRLAEIDRDLVQHEGVAQREAAQAQTDAAAAEADRDAALQALVALDVDPAVIHDIQAGRPVARIEGTIRAPIAGTVVDKLISPGQLLQAGSTPCFTVADLSRVWVMAQVAAADLGAVGVGDPAQVETGIAGGHVEGIVDNVSAVVNPDTRAVLARVVVANPQGLLKKQMYVRVRIQSRHPGNGLLAPVSAVLRDDVNLPFVYVARRDGSFARQHVTLGQRIGERYLVSDGLEAGDQVVTDGGIFVQFMQNQ
jgi:cobalt-zinc-cadmium efflux system membrane fusion protein